MSRVPLPAAVAFAVSVALLVTLLGPLLLFNPWYLGLEQARHDVPARLGTDRATVGRISDEILVDIFTDGPFRSSLDGERPLLNESERSHMSDVSRLVRILWLVVGLALTAGVASFLALRRERQRVGRLLLAAAASVGVAAAVLALIFAVAFEPTFLAFHLLFFDEGTFTFAPGSNLIALFPQGLWFESALVAGATIILAALLAGLVGWRLFRPAGG